MELPFTDLPINYNKGDYMNIKELDKAREQVYKNKRNADKEYTKVVELARQELASRNEELSQELVELNELETELINELKRNILKHFKGIKPDVRVNKYGISISLGVEEFLSHGYNVTEFHNITPKIKDKIIAEYNELFIEVSEYDDIPDATGTTVTFARDMYANMSSCKCD